MSQSPTTPSKNATTTTTIATTSSSNSISISSDIPIEIVSEEEMGFIEAALAATRSCLSSSIIPATTICSPSSLFQKNARSITAITSLSQKRLIDPDIEDLGDFKSTQIMKKNRLADQSYFYRFRKRRGLSVTDITSTEWCQKQMEFVLSSISGKKKRSEAMKAGHDRHVKLEKEVVKKVKVSIESGEDIWALKFLNFITGANQLLFDGLTRELPLVGFLGGVWVVGIVDEIRMLEGENRNPILVDTKTRCYDTLPPEPQRRNGRLQLMCYKHLWDNFVADKFPSKEFFDFFSLDPHYMLSKDIRESTAKAGIPAQTLDEILRYLRSTCNMLLPADNEMILRYEFQKGNSVIGEYKFAFDSALLNSQINDCRQFWFGEREASFTPEEERWKCRTCEFAKRCPANTTSGISSPVNGNNPISTS